MEQKYIRNFSIIAHIDHGKSTLADRLLEFTHTLPEREMVDQVLDRMDLERERGITIKLQPVRMVWEPANSKQEFVLNLIDTPGHVDFSYEVSRSLAACEGALLVVDAVQGVEAQTVANTHLALENHLEIIPIINKIDLPNADPERVKKEIEESLRLSTSQAILASAKTGEGVEDILEAIVNRIPDPKGDPKAPLRALVFDSVFNPYRGVIVFIRVVEGTIQKRMRVKFMATRGVSEVEEVGIFSPEMKATSFLAAGEVGYLITGIKEVKETKVGDTVTDFKKPATASLPGYQEAKPMVFCGLYPIDGGEYPNLRDALEKLQLNDSALSFEPETSVALGFGFRCGFLGLLHMEIVKERLEREYDLELLATAPSVAYIVTTTDGSQKVIRNPSEFPSEAKISRVEEPYIYANILTPPDFIGPLLELCQNRRGELKNVQYLSTSRVQINYYLPLSEIVLDFYDQLKSKTKGYASLDYEHHGYRPTHLVKLDILLAGKSIDAFSAIVPKEKAYGKGKALVEKLREIIPRQLFEVAIQATVGSRIIARETVKAKRKDVLAKCYGGDVTRKRKLLEKQKAGKKKMKQVGKVSIPQEAFLAVLKVGE